MPERRRPSLAGRAVLAVGLMIAFYALALGIAGLLLFIPYAEYKYARKVHAKIAVACVAGAGIILWSILPRRDRFEPPGPRLDPGKHPRLFDEIRGIAKAAGQEMPADVYLDPDVNAWVSQRGGLMGFGGRRVMAVGLPLLQVLPVSQFRGVLTHEFGHFYGGDTRLGPWVYKTHGAIFRTLANLRDDEGKSSILSLPFIGFAKLFFRVSSAISRNQEYAADELAARHSGARPFTEGLRRVHEAGAAFKPFLDGEVLPVLNSGFRPPIAEGFARFVGAKEVAGALDKIIRREMKNPVHDPYQTHPPLADRIEAVRHLPPGDVPADDPPAIALLSDVPQLETDLLVHITRQASIRKLKPLSWDEVGAKVYVPLWKNACAGARSAIAGLVPPGLPDCVPNLAQLGNMMSQRKLAPAEAQGLAANMLGAALALALLRNGWTLRADPGAAVSLRRGEEAIEPFSVIPELAQGKLAADDWKRRCASLGIAELDLAGAAD